MLLRELINSEIIRIRKRKIASYEKGRIKGYKRMLKELDGFPVNMIEEDYVELRVRIREIIGKLENADKVNKIVKRGAFKSFRNVYQHCFNRVLDPVSPVYTITLKQRQLLAIITNTIDDEFYGLSNQDANIFIGRTRHG